jgi:predicted metal-binding membrane protein
MSPNQRTLVQTITGLGTETNSRAAALFLGNIWIIIRLSMALPSASDILYRVGEVTLNSG